MNIRQPVKGLLLAGSTLGLAAPTMAAEQTTGAGKDSIRQFDVITHTRAMQSMPVVNRQGQDLGRIYDVVVSGQNRQVLYALLAVSNGGAQGGDAQQSGDGNAGQHSRQWSGNQRLIPIPFGALQIADKSVVSGRQAQMAEGGETRQPADKPERQAQKQGNGQQKQQKQQAQDDAGQGQQQQRQAAGQDRGQASRLGQMTVQQVIGLPVKSPSGETIADVREIVMGANDQPQAVVGVGGFLGIGEKTLGLPLSELELAQDGAALTTSMTRQQLEKAKPIEYQQSQTAPDDRRIATLMQGGQQGRQAQSQEQQRQASGQQDSGMQGESGDRDREQAAQHAQQQGQQTAEAKGASTMQGGRHAARQLENKVLVLNVKPSQLKQAPSFQIKQFPDMADREWHQNVIAFYKETFKNMPSVDLPEQEGQKQ